MVVTMKQVRVRYDGDTRTYVVHLLVQNSDGTVGQLPFFSLPLANKQHVDRAVIAQALGIVVMNALSVELPSPPIVPK